MMQATFDFLREAVMALALAWIGASVEPAKPAGSEPAAQTCSTSLAASGAPSCKASPQLGFGAPSTACDAASN